MAQFSSASLAKLSTCDPRLQRLFLEVVKHFDCTILEGHRDQATQEKAFAEGKTQLHYPHGNHNAKPSRAVDAIPFPVDWNDRERMTLFAGFVLGIAKGMGYHIRWGGDWDENTQVKDNKFDDLVHFEIKD